MHCRNSGIHEFGSSAPTPRPAVLGSKSSEHDILAAMNYRRGFQRIYAACCLFWIALVLVYAVVQRPRPVDWSGVDETCFKDLSCIEKFRKMLGEQERFLQTERTGSWWVAYSIVYAAIALLPPAVGYFFLFHFFVWIYRWVYRGFRPGTQM